ncbi:MAG: LPS-assembly protein LptD, partial [Alistipes sp.]|nr:LPS-assembly protein LptD [Alistipes sp.]
MKKFRLKYLLVALITVIMIQSLFGISHPKRIVEEQVGRTITTIGDSATRQSDTAIKRQNLRRRAAAMDSQRIERRRRLAEAKRQKEEKEATKSDSLSPAKQSTAMLSEVDSIASDSLKRIPENDSIVVKRDTTKTKKKKGGGGLDQIVDGKNTDSLCYDVLNKQVYIYNQGDVKYEEKSLQADFMRIDMNKKEIYAYGKADTTAEGLPSRTQPVFNDSGSSYTMDTITYNFDSEKAIIQGVATQQGDGWLVGGRIKKMPDNTINMKGGKYTTCEQTDNPHFYLAMTKAKVIPGKKVITGPAYLVMEDVPIYFLGIPEGFFPMNMGPKSGLLMPTFGEDGARGFFLRGLGYYFILNQHIDLAVTGGFYTLGSWEVAASSRYTKRY